QVIPVTRNHVARTGDVGELGVRDELEELVGALPAEEVALAATNKERGYRDLLGGAGQSPGIDDRCPRLVRTPTGTAEEPWIPMPHPPAVVPPSQVLLQAGQVAGPRPMWVVALYRVRDLVQGPEPVRNVLQHE